MNEEPKSIWKKSWTGWRALPILISLLVSAGFLAALASSLFHFVNGKIFDLSFFVYWLIFTIGVIVTFLLVVGLFRFVRWLCCWKNISAISFWPRLFCHADCAVLCRGRLARLARLEPIQAPMGSQRRKVRFQGFCPAACAGRPEFRADTNCFFQLRPNADAGGKGNSRQPAR